MARIRRWIWLLGFLVLMPLGCAPALEPGDLTQLQQVLRVRLLEDRQQVQIAVSDNPTISTEEDPTVHPVNFPRDTPITLSRTQGRWQLGSLSISGGVLTLRPGAEGSVQVEHTAYRGVYRFVPVGGDKFDVVNVVNVEGYLKGVLPKELLSDWRPEAYKAQAIVARTYSLYVAQTEGRDRYWDLFADQRSQVYGGIAAETAKSREAVDETGGVVLAWGPGVGKIFKAYFSSCCGGVTQAAADAFPGDERIEPLSEQNDGACCIASKHFNWGPIAISKVELTRRFRLWGQNKAKSEHHPVAEERMDTIASINLQAVNHYGRPTRFVMTDSRGTQYTLAAEDVRWAVNTDAAAGTTLPSGFCQISVSGDSIVFHDGHGFGHGVGMCQYCAEARAAAGWRHEDILAAAYPQTRLVRAY